MTVDLAALTEHRLVAFVLDIAARGLTYGLAALDLGRGFVGLNADAGRFGLAVGRLEAVAS
jgi:hypothetical protein